MYIVYIYSEVYAHTQRETQTHVQTHWLVAPCRQRLMMYSFFMCFLVLLCVESQHLHMQHTWFELSCCRFTRSKTKSSSKQWTHSWISNISTLIFALAFVSFGTSTVCQRAAMREPLLWDERLDSWSVNVAAIWMNIWNMRPNVFFQYF